MQFNERFLYHIWDAQHLLENLKTISGKTLKVLFPGRWNTDAGPDFKEAILNLDGEIIRGDVEIELETYNWKIHEHHENPAYNSVILQVVYDHNGQYLYNFNEKGERFEILELKNFVNQDIAKLVKKYSQIHQISGEKLCPLLNKFTPEEFRSFLTELGKERFGKKVKRFSAEHYFADYDQLLYQGLMESLGYSKNKFQMVQLAQRIPYKKIKELWQRGMSKEQLTALLLGSSNLVNHLPSSFPTELKNKWIEEFFSLESKIKIIPVKWQLFRIRPQNHPAIRILQLVEVLNFSFQTSLFKEVLKLFSFSKEKFNLPALRKKIYAFFQATPTFLPEKYKLGKTRIDTMVINIILPLLSLYSTEKNYQDLQSQILRIYLQYPGLTWNYITDFMECFLTETNKKIIHEKAIFQQGLIKLYFDKCKYHDCGNCTLI